jgi:pimeloyl-ACP methyl ester carboxylesterase
LSESRPVYAIDVPGFGRSSRCNFSLDPIVAEQQFVDSIEEWRKSMKIEKMVLCGHSFGGYLVISLLHFSNIFKFIDRKKFTT